MSSTYQLQREAYPQFLDINPDNLPDTDNPEVNDKIYRDGISSFGKPTRQQLWFARNVIFYLATGVVVTDSVRQIVRIILEYLSPMKDRILLNRYQLLEYEDELSVKLDTNKTIHGNYSLALHIFVADDADIYSIDCPEPYYAKHGEIDTKYDDRVLEYFTAIIQTYAFSRRRLPEKPVLHNRANVIVGTPADKQTDASQYTGPMYKDDRKQLGQQVNTPCITDYIDDTPSVPGGLKGQARYNSKYAQNTSLVARAFRPSNANVPLLGMYKPALTTTIAPRMRITTENQFTDSQTGKMFG